MIMQMDKTNLYKTPFSRAYWHQAMSDFKSLRMLVFAALMVAIRIALKPVGIPRAADLRISAGFSSMPMAPWSLDRWSLFSVP